MDDQPINQPKKPAMKPRLVVPRVCVGIILGVWVLSGFSKVIDLNAFVNTVTEHKVLPQELFGMMWWVGPGELVLGLLLVFVMGSELTKFFGRAVLVFSMFSIVGLTYYLSLVSDAVLLESGCGCFDGITRIDFGMDVQEALDSPRAFPGAAGIEVEKGISAEVRSGLEARGHDVRNAMLPFGGGQAIYIDRAQGGLVGGSDPRKDGAAVGY